MRAWAQSGSSFASRADGESGLLRAQGHVVKHDALEVACHDSRERVVCGSVRGS